MAVFGIVCEYNPFHRGHAYLLRHLRRQGAQAIVCAMSGNFVQRGEAAIVGKLARAEMAVRCGADLVLEIPTPWSAATAETFARGGVSVLAQTGVVTHLAFGSECGDVSALRQVADALDSEAYRVELRQALTDSGAAFAACRQQAIAHLLGRERAAILEEPNNILGVEYLRCLRSAGIQAVTVKRQGACHDEQKITGGVASAAHVRALLRGSAWEEAMACMPPAAASVLARELAAHRAPADIARCERAILAHLRKMDEEDLRRWDGGGEGLYHRLYRAVRQSTSLEEVLQKTKTKRYPLARLRRMVLAAWLDLPTAPTTPLPYLRLLACSDTGRTLLRRMKGVPVLTKAADVGRLGQRAEALFRQESRRNDLYALCTPRVLPCGEDWRITPLLLSEKNKE